MTHGDRPAGLIWLASYPKSGNTWLRSLLTAYLAPNGPLDLNSLVGKQFNLDRQLLDDYAGISSADFSREELLPYRAALHRHLAFGADTDLLFLKTHCLFEKTRDGQELFPATAGAKAVYLARDPRDIASSLAAHEGRDIEWALRRMSDPASTLDEWPDRISPQLPQYTSTWSAHVTSWLDQRSMPVHLLRYEDLLQAPERGFASVLAYCGLGIDEARLTDAIESTSFERLQAKEKETGFGEAPASATEFFRSGKALQGENILSPEQLARIETEHALAMRRLGYRQAGG